MFAWSDPVPKAVNRNKLIVCVRLLFSIFHSHEDFILAGLPVRDAKRDLKVTREQIYTNHTGCPRPDSS